MSRPAEVVAIGPLTVGVRVTDGITTDESTEETISVGSSDSPTVTVGLTGRPEAAPEASMPTDDGEISAETETSIPDAPVVAVGTSVDTARVVSETMVVATPMMEPASTMLDDTTSPTTEVSVDSGRSLVMEATTVGSMRLEAVDRPDARIEDTGSLTPTVAEPTTSTRPVEEVMRPTDAVTPAETGPADTVAHTTTPRMLAVQVVRGPADTPETTVVITAVIGLVAGTVALAETSTKLDESPRTTDAVTPPEIGSTTLAVIPGTLDTPIKETAGILIKPIEEMLALTATVSPPEMATELDATKLGSVVKLVASTMLAAEVTIDPMAEATSEVSELSTELTSGTVVERDKDGSTEM
jgi:hypothetical protein